MHHEVDVDLGLGQVTPEVPHRVGAHRAALARIQAEPLLVPAGAAPFALHQGPDFRARPPFGGDDDLDPQVQQGPGHPEAGEACS